MSDRKKRADYFKIHRRWWKPDPGTAHGFTTILLGILGLWGWIQNVLNVMELWGLDTLSTQEILQVVGVVVPPLGAVLGWIV